MRTRALAASLALGVLFSSACAPELDEERDPSQGVLSQHSSALFTDKGKILTVVAHQDDDIFLVNPTFMQSLRSNAVTASLTVVMTSGENNASDGDTCEKYVRGRESGEKAAYMAMLNQPIPLDQAGIDARWTTNVETYAGQKVRVLTNNADNRIKILYLGLQNSHTRDLEQIWRDWSTGTKSIKTRYATPGNPAQEFSYTRGTLIQSLQEIITKFGPDHVNILDAGKTMGLDPPSEHSDHVHSALFTIAALQGLPHKARTIRMHRSYNTAFEEENLSEAEATEKRKLYNAYAKYDPYLCTGISTPICDGARTIICNNPLGSIYNLALYRQYAVDLITDARGVITAPDDPALGTKRCVRVAGGKLVPGACAGASEWFLDSSRGVLVDRATNNCVTPTTPNALRGSTLELKACVANSPAQRFHLNGWGQLRGPDATCVSAKEAELKLQECDALFRGDDKVTDKLNFTVLAGKATSRSPDPVLNNNVFSEFDSVAYGNIGGDAADDVCVRRDNGIWCAINTAGTFGAFTQWSTRFSGAKYRPDSFGGTMMLANINDEATKLADVCMRTDDGIECALNNGDGKTFKAPLPTNTNAFGFWTGFGLDDSYWGSLRMVDVTNDGRADVCGRNDAGIECAIANANGSFQNPQQFMRDQEFTMALGWNASETGTTIQFGDIDGDGRPDVCGRSMHGMICAIFDTVTRQFVKPHLWSNPGDFSDDQAWDSNPSVYRSIRLGDINGDGRADVCGRSTTGVQCALSMGTSFARARPLYQDDLFTNAKGYGVEPYGASMALVNLDLNNRKDVCFRGPVVGGSRLYCATSF